jgi:hypothetical protein
MGKPLTGRVTEFTCLEFGSPNATLFITKNREFVENLDA